MKNFQKYSHKLAITEQNSIKKLAITLPLAASDLQGLSQEEAAQRLKKEGPNKLPESNKRNFIRIFFDLMREPMFSLLLAGGLVYWLLGDTTEALMLLVFASISVSITFVQESRSERVLESLRDLASPRALVIRDGQRQHIAGKDVVRGDLLLVNEGDRVAADAQLLAVQNLLLDESLLTGESVALGKIAGSNSDKSAIYAGTLVVGGTASARVTATGLNTQMGQIGSAIKNIDPQQPRLKRQLAWLVRDFAFIGAAAALVVVLLYGFLRGSWLEAILAGIAIGMSLLPEEFPLVITVFMAMGAWRISQAGVLTRRSSAIETLGATTVLCTDKTGTLTQNRMSLVALAAAGESWCQLDHQAINSAGKVLLKAALLASPLNPVDPMDIAVHHLAESHFNSEPPRPDLLRAYGLKPGLLATTNIFAQAGKSSLAYSKGALETIAELCHLSPEIIERLRAQANELANKGMRVLAVAKAEVPAGELPESPGSLQFDYMGLLAFADPLRETVPVAVAECQAAGIRVVMITGDYPATAAAIAAQAGIHGDEILVGDQIEKLCEFELTEKLKTVSIFARIRPQQKLRLVQALKSNGEIVAMTGDGVNDAPAIKAAHIGIAMGGRGTDVAREASSIVLLNDDFGSIVKTIRLGRRIYDNLLKAIEFIVAVHIPIAGLAILPLLMGLPMILTPIHIAFLEMVIDPACSVVFEAEQEEENVMTRPPRDPLMPLLIGKRIGWAVTQGLVALLLLAGLLTVGSRMQMPENDLRTLVFSTLVLFNMGLILINRSFRASLVSALLRPNRSLWILLSAVSVTLAIAVGWPPAQTLFSFGRFHLNEFFICIALSILCLLFLEGIKMFWFRKKID
jgi:P-type Ca2+ transporter type 2C